MLPPFAYVKPRNVQEALKHLLAEHSAAHAGGTDLLGCLRERIFPVQTVVSLSGFSELSGIVETGDGGMRLGALTTISQIAAHPGIREKYPVLAQAAGEVASPQLRNQGTIGGNICQKPRCWYYRGEFHCLRKGGDTCYAINGDNRYHCILGGAGCVIVHPSDPAPALCALGATVRIMGGNGPRTVPVESFFMPPERDVHRETVLEPGEIVTDIFLPAPVGAPLTPMSAYRKIRARRSWDFALAGTAISLALEDRTVSQARIYLSGAAPVPWHAARAEEALVGRKLDKDAIHDAAQAVVDGADPLSGNGYKIPLFKGVLTEELEKLAAI